MVEIVLLSIALLAVLLFLRNMRAGVGPKEQRAMLDGAPKWVDATIASITPKRTLLGMTVAEITLEIGSKTEDVIGPIPPSYEAQIVVGLPVRAHIEYDLLDTLRTDLWDSDPSAVLGECAARLSVEATITGTDPRELECQVDGRDVGIMLASDGWLTIMVPHTVGGDYYVDLRAEFDDAESTHMLTPKLGTTLDEAEDARDLLDALRPETLARLEAMALTEGWICIESESIEFEFALPFPEGDLAARCVSESVAIVKLIEADVAAPAGEPADGAW